MSLKYDKCAGVDIKQMLTWNRLRPFTDKNWGTYAVIDIIDVILHLLGQEQMSVLEKAE